MNCKECGAPIFSSSRYCQYCGEENENFGILQFGEDEIVRHIRKICVEKRIDKSFSLDDSFLAGRDMRGELFDEIKPYIEIKKFRDIKSNEIVYKLEMWVLDRNYKPGDDHD